MCKASKRKSPNDAKRYIKSEYCTADGELAQIENGFRTMKTDLRARPVYLKRDDRYLIQCKLKCKTDKVWNEFETIQSDIFDHLIAMSSEFGLKMYELSV